MVIDLKKLLQTDGSVETLRCELDFSGVELGGAKPFCAPVRVQVRLRGFAGSVEMQAQADYSITAACDRCAEEFTRECTGAYAHTLAPQGQEDGDIVLVPEEKLDLDRLLLENILLDMPGQLLCREDCKGLCPMCGKNLNEGPCGCEAPAADPRLEVLRQLLEQED